jgi:hypothetical protein
MVEWAGVAAHHRPRPWWLQALYAVLVASALALVTVVAGEIYFAVESPDEHGRFASIVDLAWLVFLPTTLATLLGAMVGSIGGRLGHSAPLTRYSVRATAYLALAIGTVAVVAVLVA